MTEKDKVALRAAYARVIERAWRDPSYKASLLANPGAALSAEGIPVPPGLTVKGVEETDEVAYFVLPRPKHLASISDQDLEKILCDPIRSSIHDFCDNDRFART